MGARHYCHKILQVKGTRGTCANSTPVIILKDVAILKLKLFKIFVYVSVSKCKWVSGVDTYEGETAPYSIIWELFARKSDDIHESSLLILWLTLGKATYWWQWSENSGLDRSKNKICKPCCIKWNSEMEIRNIDLSDFLPNYQGSEATF